MFICHMSLFMSGVTFICHFSCHVSLSCVTCHFSCVSCQVSLSCVTFHARCHFHVSRHADGEYTPWQCHGMRMLMVITLHNSERMRMASTHHGSATACFCSHYRLAQLCQISRMWHIDKGPYSCRLLDL